MTQLSGMNKRQRRRNRHRYQDQVIPQKSIIINFSIETAISNQAFAALRENMALFSRIAPDFREIIEGVNLPLMPLNSRKHIAIDTGTLRPSYKCGFFALTRTERYEYMEDAEIAWTRQQAERMELMSRQRQAYIGNRSCRFNARSHLIQRAVNPLGRCGECPHKNI